MDPPRRTYFQIVLAALGEPVHWNAISAPVPVISITFACAFSLRKFTVYAAPSFFAISRRFSSPSTAIMFLTPIVRTAVNNKSPIGPHPCTSTYEPCLKLKICFACSTAWIITAAGSISVRKSTSISLTLKITPPALILMYSPNQPLKFLYAASPGIKPKISPFGQRWICSGSFLHVSHTPQGFNPVTILSPSFKGFP